jgi:hypothetical protein
MQRISIDGIPEETVKRYGLDRVPLDRPFQCTSALLHLDGKCAVVTGGGGDGFGNACLAASAASFVHGTTISVSGGIAD